MKFIIKYCNNLYSFNTKSALHKKVSWLKRKAMQSISSINLNTIGQKEMVLRMGKLSFDDEWNLTTVPYGTILHCHMYNPIILEGVCLKVRLAFSGESIYFSSIDWDNSVFDIKLALQERLGIPIGVFRLCYEGEELYDVQTLKSIPLPKGSHLVCESWDGWNEFLLAAKHGMTGSLEDILSSEPKVRLYQLHVGLHMVAHLGHTEFAERMIMAGARGDRPVGPHPLKRWCLQRKENPAYYSTTPMHVATAHGHLSILVLIVQGNPSSINILNGNGETPLAVAIRENQKECKRFLEKEIISQKIIANQEILPTTFRTQLSNNLIKDVPTKFSFSTIDSKANYKRCDSLEQRLSHKFSANMMHVDRFHSSQQNSVELKSLSQMVRPNGRVAFKSYPSNSSKGSAKLDAREKFFYFQPSSGQTFRKAKKDKRTETNELVKLVQERRGQTKEEKARACLCHATIASKDTYLSKVRLASKLNSRNLLEKIDYSEKMKITII